MGLDIILTLVCALAVLVVIAVILMKKRTAYLGPVKEELQKEKAWLRRGEYNAAMVKGRQNLELLLRLVAEKNGIQLDNTAQAVASAREEEERQSQNGRRPHRGREKTKKIMTHHQFNRWLSDNGYLDRVARWEMNQVRLIGNKAVHENYADKDDAWNQYNYLEDILKTVTEKSQNPKKHHERKDVEKNGPAKNDAVKKEAPQKDSKNKKYRKDSADVKSVNPVVEKKNEADVLETSEKKKKRRRKKKSSKPAAETVAIVETLLAAPAEDVKKQKPKKKKSAKPVKEEVKPEQKAEQKQEKKNNPAEARNAEDLGEAAKKKRRRRRKKPQSSNVQAESVVAVEPTREVSAGPVQKPAAEKDSVESKKVLAETKVTAESEKDIKNKRRRRKKKPQSSNVQAESVVAAESTREVSAGPVQKPVTEKSSVESKKISRESKHTPAESNNVEDHGEATKKKRRRRRRKPHAQAEGGAAVDTVVPEYKNESN